MDDYQYQEDTITNKNNTDITTTANEIRKKVASKGRPKKSTRKYEPLQKEEPVINDLEKYQNEPVKPEPEPEKPEPEKPVEAVKEVKPVLPVINENKPMPDIETITEDEIYDYLLFKQFKTQNKKIKNKPKPVSIEPETTEEEEELPKPVKQVKQVKPKQVKQPQPKPVEKPPLPDYLHNFTSQYGTLF